METLRAFLYSIGIFIGLAIMAALVALIMTILYLIVHRSRKKNEGSSENEPVDSASPGKEG
jgi:hypothetical protein